MRPTTEYRIETYCLIAYNAMRSNLYLWKSKPNDKDVLRGVTRPYYDLVHSLSIPSGYITVNALQEKQNDSQWILCKDHCYSPQFIGRMIMDHSEIYLEDYERFRQLFYKSCTTIDITPEENRKLSLLTSNQNGYYKILVPTDKKYQHLNIQLVKRNYGRNWYHKPTDPVSNYIETPEELLHYEKQFLIE
jgi:hypothetical protein